MDDAFRLDVDAADQQGLDQGHVLWGDDLRVCPSADGLKSEDASAEERAS